tara:strand:+ start:220 stop:528 length:309 start_codon:yes stop_codon:yes gene_type:complete
MSTYYHRGILLDRFGDSLGTRTKKIFDTKITPGSNWVQLKLKDVWVELQTDQTDTSFKLIVRDDIEQLEKLAFWSGQLNKDVKKHIKKLKTIKKKEVKNESK